MGIFNAHSLDVLTMGRIGVDIYPLKSGLGLHEVDAFGRFLGGSPTNVAVAAARLGSTSAVITGVGDDPFGLFCREELGRLGVFDDYVHCFPGESTPVAFCEIFPPDDFPIYFYRRPIAPDLLLRQDDLPIAAIEGCGVFWITGTGFCAEPSRSTHLAALEIRGKRNHTIIDLDYRASFWRDPLEARSWVRAALPQCSIAVGNVQECEVAVGEKDRVKAGKKLLGLGVEMAIVKDGPRGALAVTHDEMIHIPATEVEILNGLGSGDAFGGTLCHGLTEGWSLEEILPAASAAGAIVASRLECSTAMPTLPELRRMVSRNPQKLQRIQENEEKHD